MFVRFLGLTLAILIAWIVFARPSSGSRAGELYVVRPHDTLWTIASRRYGGDPREGVWRLQERNHLVNTVIRPGQRLVLP
jgi:LysM repeat protein